MDWILLIIPFATILSLKYRQTRPGYDRKPTGKWYFPFVAGRDLSLVSSLLPILILQIHSQHLTVKSPKSLQIITTSYRSACSTNQHCIKSGYHIHIKMSMNNIQAVYCYFYFLSVEDDREYLTLTMGFYMLLLPWLVC